MKHLLTFVLGLLPLYSSAQYISGITIPDTTIAKVMDETDVAYRISQSITSEDLSEHLHVLASDEYEGRETGAKGNDLAAAYIANQFKSMGLPAIGAENSYYQMVAFNKTKWDKNEIKVNGNSYKHLWDYLAFATLNTKDTYLESNEIYFLGYGIDDPKYSDYKGDNLNGKVILINEGEPTNNEGVSHITGSKETSEWTDNIYKKLELAKSKGVRHVFIISNDVKKFLAQNRKFLMSANLELGDGTHDSDFANHSYISTNIAKDLIGKKDKRIKRWRKKNKKKGKAGKVKLRSGIEYVMDKNVDILNGRNVIGYIEGTDKKDELIVISAHYDHLGKRGQDIFNGADDNGSGTSTVLEIASAFAQAKAEGNGPRRSVLCLLVTGEEKGLLGSQYYAENPLFPLENTVANVNIDMVGRVDEKHKDNPEYIYVIGSDRLSSDLHKINERVNQKYTQVTLDYQYNDEADPNRYYFRSDHYNFARKGIPAIFFFNGTHEDYHRTSDTVEKINFDKMEKVGRLFFHTAWELANREDRIIVDGKVEE